MNSAHFHLVVNHFPIILPVVGLMLLLAGFLLRSELLKRAAYCLFVLSSICTILAFSSGEGAEEMVENMDGFQENFIERHEAAAKPFALFSHALAVLSLVGIWASWKNKSFSKIIGGLSIVFALIVLFFAQKTGTSGGEIRHTEIRSTTTQAPEKPIEKGKEEEED